MGFPTSPTSWGTANKKSICESVGKLKAAKCEAAEEALLQA